VLNPGEAALPEAVFMAGFGHFKVIVVDYHLPPDILFPGRPRRRHDGVEGGAEAGGPE